LKPAALALDLAGTRFKVPPRPYKRKNKKKKTKKKKEKGGKKGFRRQALPWQTRLWVPWGLLHHPGSSWAELASGPLSSGPWLTQDI
jgi:hypothetical protein